jgi:hypothetical protein
LNGLVNVGVCVLTGNKKPNASSRFSNGREQDRAGINTHFQESLGDGESFLRAANDHWNHRSVQAWSGVEAGFFCQRKKKS